MIYQGNCHCGAVSFELEAAEHIEVEDCNCSICLTTQPKSIHIVKFDGQNWEKNAYKIAHKSVET